MARDHDHEPDLKAARPIGRSLLENPDWRPGFAIAALRALDLRSTCPEGVAMASPAATPDPRDPHATPRSALPIFLTCWLALLADGYDLYVYGATQPGFIGPQNWG